MATRKLEILQPIGSGGQGSVYLARLRGGHGFERLVAVKVVRAEADRRSGEEERFIHEARLLGMLRHRGIVVADDLVELDGGLAIVMEYIPGIDLSAVLQLGAADRGLVTVGWLAHIGFEVVSALQTAWTSPSPLNGEPLRALHCDVKPSNIRVTPHGEVKLLDFGVATSHLVEDPVHMGTASYAAPERLTGGISTPAGDLFSLGLTLLAVARGRGMTGRPQDALAHDAWARVELQRLEDTPYQPLVPLLESMTHGEPRLRPAHDEARARFYALLRAHADGPPQDTSSRLVERIVETSDPGQVQHAARTATDPLVQVQAPRGAITLIDEEERSDPGVSQSEVETLDQPRVLPPPGPVTVTPAEAARDVLGRSLGGSEPTLTVNRGGGILDHLTAAPRSMSEEKTRVVVSPDPPETDFKRLLNTWFHRGPADRGVAPAQRTGAGHAFRLFGACSIFRGWFTVDAAQVALAPYADELGVEVAEALDHLLRTGGLEARPGGGVALFRITRSEVPAALDAVREWPEKQRLQLAEAYAAYLLRILDDAALDGICQGIGPAGVLVESYADDLDRLSMVPPLGERRACRLAGTVLRYHLSADSDAIRARFARLVEETADAPRLRARVLRWQGQFLIDSPEGDLETHLERVDAAIDLAAAVRDVRNEAALWSQRGVWMLWRGEREDGLLAFSHALDMCREQGDALRGALCALNLSILLRKAGREEEAWKWGCEAERTCAELGAGRLHVTVLANLANQARERHDTAQASRLSTRAVFAGRRLGRLDSLSHALACRGLVALSAGDLESAVADLEEAHASARHTRGHLGVWAQVWLAGTLWTAGRIPEAAQHLAEAQAHRHEVFGDTAVCLQAWTARVAATRGKGREARAALARAEDARAAYADLQAPTVDALLRATRADVGDAAPAGSPGRDSRRPLPHVVG